jgi:hypothetical protein
MAVAVQEHAVEAAVKEKVDEAAMVQLSVGQLQGQLEGQLEELPMLPLVQVVVVVHLVEEHPHLVEVSSVSLAWLLLSLPVV